MSYARWSDESDVYVFAHVGGYVDCCGCARLHSAEEVVTHMQWHRVKHDRVPQYLFDVGLYPAEDFEAHDD